MTSHSTTAEDLAEYLRGGPIGPKIAAVFDFDGTLIEGNSASALYEHRLRRGELGPAELVRVLRSVNSPIMSLPHFTELVESMLHAWAGRTEEEVSQIGDRLFSHSIAGDLFHEAWRLVKAHQRMGHTVVIATSATRMQVAPLARELGVEHVVCTEMAVVDGVLTGSVVRPVPWGTGKLNAVIEFLNRHDIEAASTHAYANGDEDIPLLTAVGHPHPVNPQPKLATVARAHRWPVLEFAGRKPARLDPTPALRTAAAFGTLFTSAGAGVVLGVLKGNRRVGVDVATSLFQTLAGPLAGVTFEVTGEHNAWSHRPAVFFINHQSTMVDFMVATRVIRTGFTAIAKAEVKEMPLVGHLFDMAGVAFVDRSNSKAAISALLPVVQTLKSGISVVIAPEGTRSLTPALGQFKKGGFHLARQAGVPIVPVVVRNSGEIMSRNARTMRPGKVEIAVLPPIDTAAWTANDVSEQAAVMRQLYQDTLENWPSTLATRGR